MVLLTSSRKEGNVNDRLSSTTNLQANMLAQSNCVSYVRMMTGLWRSRVYVQYPSNVQLEMQLEMRPVHKHDGRRKVKR